MTLYNFLRHFFFWSYVFFFSCFFFLADNKILSALTAYEPEILMTVSENNLPNDPALKIISLMSDLYDRELVGTIGWAKQIPGNK